MFLQLQEDLLFWSPMDSSEGIFLHSLVLLWFHVCYRVAYGSSFVSFFPFLGFPYHRVSMQDIDRCLLVEARTKLPELRWLISSLLLLIYCLSCCTNNELHSWFFAAASVTQPTVHLVASLCFLLSGKRETPTCCNYHPYDSCSGNAFAHSLHSSLVI